MSFFKSKQIQITVRGQFLNFNVISKGELENMKYYGKAQEFYDSNPEFAQLGSDEMTQLLASKIIAKDGETVPTAKDLDDLCNDEIRDMVVKVTGSSETLKKALNK